VLARGDAAINLRFPHKGYREKIWDHAAGALIVQEAGAVISDASGASHSVDPLYSYIASLRYMPELTHT
jgi:3'-phosphoadenosine 5'-phosphosulfate (PAPS) 3'-phosphatase